MYGESETSYLPRALFSACNLAGFAASVWLLGGEGLVTVGAWFGARWMPGDGRAARRAARLLLTYAILGGVFVVLGSFVFAKRVPQH